MPASDDLAALLAQKPKATMRPGWGKIVEWNPETFDNVIDWGGTRLENLPIVGTTDALSYQPGQYVLLHSADESGEQGTTQWWIAGRILIPGTDNAEQIIDFLRGSLAREISAEIFADRIKPAYNADYGTREEDTFGDLDGTEVGPSVTAVVGDSGLAIVDLSATNQLFLGGSIGSEVHFSGLVSVEVSGATTLSADDTNSIRGTIDGDVTTNSKTETLTQARPVILTGLNPGEHTFTMKYRKWEGATGATTRIQVGERSIIVTAF